MSQKAYRALATIVRYYGYKQASCTDGGQRMTNTKNMSNTREDIRTAIFSLAYQHTVEEQWGDEDSKMTPEEIAAAVRHLERAYAKLTNKKDADEIHAAAYRAAQQRVHGD